MKAGAVNTARPFRKPAARAMASQSASVSGKSDAAQWPYMTPHSSSPSAGQCWRRAASRPSHPWRSSPGKRVGSQSMNVPPGATTRFRACRIARFSSG